MFYQGGPIDYFTHVPGSFAQYSAEIEYDAACTVGIALKFIMINNELMNKDTYVVLEQAPLTILDR